MATIASGGNATISLNAGETISIEPQEKATVRFESPTGTLLAQFNDKRTFGPYTAGRSVKVLSVTGAVYYEVGTGRSSGVIAFNPDANVGVYWGTGAPTLTAGQGSMYLRLDGSSTSTRLYVNLTGAATWTAVTTAA